MDGPEISEDVQRVCGPDPSACGGSMHPPRPPYGVMVGGMSNHSCQNT